MKLNAILKMIDSTPLHKILVLWLALIFSFSIIFFFLSFSDSNALYYLGIPVEKGFEGFLSALYFSFVTATTLGYGDIHPVGLARLFSVIEAIIGFFILAFFVSKLVSIKQEKLLRMVYDISRYERISRLKSANYLSRNELDRLTANLRRTSIFKSY